MQGHAGSSYFPPPSFGGICSSAGLPESQDFPEPRPPPSSCPHCMLSPEQHIHLPFSFPRMPSPPVLWQLAGSPSSTFFCLRGSYSTSKGQIQGHCFRAAPPHPHLVANASVPTSVLPDTVLTPELIHAPNSLVTYLFKTYTGSSSKTEALSQLSVFKIQVVTPQKVIKLFQWVVTSSDFFNKVEPKISEYIEHSKSMYSEKSVSILYYIDV